jgi:NhaA family Na+:H+ antiporter
MMTLAKRKKERKSRVINFDFLQHEAAGGVVLCIAAILALIVANSPLGPAYDHLLHTPVTLGFPPAGLTKSALHWINDGLMAIFFFLVGLEIKRELTVGALKSAKTAALPVIAAGGGMVVPALIYVTINWNDPIALNGWAIPAATDIAFALGVLALVGSRAPSSLKVFLLTLAILDDLGAIVIIALFYTADLKVEYLLMALAPLAGLVALNLRGTHRVAPALLLGVVMWVFVLKSGVHATLAGVITAFLIPLKDRFGKSPLHTLEHGLSLYVAYLIVPVFAFANAGVILQGMSIQSLLAPLPLGVALGLVLGKQAGVFGVTYLVVRSGWARLPAGANWAQIYGVACLAGIGFTMSLFIGSLSFSSPALMNEVRLGVLAGSLISAVMGYAVLMLAGVRAGKALPA